MNQENDTTDEERSEQIQALMGLSEDRLYTILGNQLAESTGTLYGPAEAMRNAREWLDHYGATNREKICQYYRTRKAKDKFASNVTLVSALAEFLLKLGGYPGGVTVAVLLVMRGLDAFCNERQY
jgi:hypothetical protein